MNSLHQMLARLRDRGIKPNGFIDVGAHFGETNQIMRSIFPDKRVISFEANPKCGPILDQSGAEYLICLLGDQSGETVEFYLDPNHDTSTGCSIYKEKSEYFKDAKFIELPMYRLDHVVPIEAKLDFLKMDVQGAEISVMEGATQLLPTIKWIYLEVSFVQTNEGAPLFGEVFNYLTKKGYRISDICDPTWVNNELLQCNFLFERV